MLWLQEIQCNSGKDPIPGKLREDRTTVGGAFEVIGLDFAGPLKYKEGKKSQGKAYLAIFTCSLSRAVHQELIASLETDNFIVCHLLRQWRYLHQS